MKSSTFPGRSFVLIVLTLACCAMLLRASYDRGIARGMEAVLEWGPNYAQVAIAAAITDLVYNFNLGYVAADPVYNKLWHTIEQTGPLDESVLPRLRDAQLINRAITEASQLGPLTPGYVDQGTLISMYYNDLGYIDYIKIAFRLFGMHIESLYLFFFVLLGISIGMFILAFRENVLASLTIVTFTFWFFAEINSDVFDAYMPTVYGLRYPSVLAIVPTLHLVLLLVRRTPFSIWSGVLAGGQAAVLIFAIKMRSAAQWGMIAIAFVIALYFIKRVVIESRSRQGWELALARALPDLVRWPFVIAVGLLVAHAAYMRMALHPVYESDDVLTSHPFWHTVFVNYARLDEDAGALSNYETGDEIGYNASRIYAKKTHLVSDPAHLGSALTGTALRIGFNDQLLRRVFLGYASQHPLRVARRYLVDNPMIIARAFLSATLGAPGALPRVFPAWTLLAGLLVCGVCAAVMSLLPWDRAEGHSLLFALSIVSVASALPLGMIVLDPVLRLADILIVWPAAISMAVPLSFIVALRYKSATVEA